MTAEPQFDPKPFEKALEDEVAANVRPLQRPFSSTNVEAFLDHATKLYAGQRIKVRDLESAYLLERAKLMDQFERRLADLRHEALEALRSLDNRHTAVIGDAKQVLQKLGQMRE